MQDIFCNFVAILKTTHHINPFKQTIALLLLVLLAVANGIPVFHNHDVENGTSLRHAETINKGVTHCNICFEIESRFMADEPPLLNWTAVGLPVMRTTYNCIFISDYKNILRELSVNRGPPSIVAAC